MRGTRCAFALIILGWAAGLALTPSVAAAGTRSPVLGSKAFIPMDGAGWGEAHPRTIFNGGDPSGLVQDIAWSHWGAKTVYGYGKTALFKPGGGYYAQAANIELRASSLGTCHAGGAVAYKVLSFRAPARPGGTFGKWQLWSGRKNICQPY